MNKFICHLLIGLKINNNPNEEFNHCVPVIFLCIDYLNDYAMKFKDFLLPFLPQIIDLLEKNYKKLKFEQDGCEIINMILEFFNTSIDEFGKIFLNLSHKIIMEIIDEICFRKTTVFSSEELIVMRSECLSFLTKLCFIDLSLVYKRKLQIINLLNEISDTCAEELFDIDSYINDEDYFDDIYDTETLLFNSFYLIE